MDLNTAIYEWVNGTHVNKVKKKHILQILSFTKYLWNNSKKKTSNFQLASEAFLSRQQLLSQVENRFIKLEKRSKYFENLRVFLEFIFKPTWKITFDWAKNHWPSENINKTLTRKELTLSPSDFDFITH